MLTLCKHEGRMTPGKAAVMASLAWHLWLHHETLLMCKIKLSRYSCRRIAIGREVLL